MNWTLESPGARVIEAGRTCNLDGAVATGLGGETSRAEVAVRAGGEGSLTDVDGASGVDPPPHPRAPITIKRHAIHPEIRLATIHPP